MFRNAKVNDRAWDMLRGWGTITHIAPNEKCPIHFVADVDSFSTFTFEGKRNSCDKNPTLFWKEIKFKIPKKPFDLENELRKLKIKEFKEFEENYYLIWDFNDNRLDYACAIDFCSPFIKFFTIESIEELFDNLETGNVSKEKFIEVYKRVFGGR